MSSEPELARRLLEVLAEEDGAAFGELVADDVEIHTARGIRTGHAEAVAWAAGKYAHLRRRYTAEDVRQTADGAVVVHGRTEYVWKETGELADSSPVAIEMRFRDRLLAHWRFLEESP